MPWTGPGTIGRAARIPELITHANPEWLADFIISGELDAGAEKRGANSAMNPGRPAE